MIQFFVQVREYDRYSVKQMFLSEWPQIILKHYINTVRLNRGHENMVTSDNCSRK